MYTMSKNYGQASYTLESADVKAYITVVGGHITADFYNGKNIFSPFFYHLESGQNFKEHYRLVMTNSQRRFFPHAVSLCPLSIGRISP